MGKRLTCTEPHFPSSNFAADDRTTILRHIFAAPVCRQSTCSTWCRIFCAAMRLFPFPDILLSVRPTRWWPIWQQRTPHQSMCLIVLKKKKCIVNGNRSDRILCRKLTDHFFWWFYLCLDAHTSKLAQKITIAVGLYEHFIMNSNLQMNSVSFQSAECRFMLFLIDFK